MARKMNTITIQIERERVTTKKKEGVVYEETMAHYLNSMYLYYYDFQFNQEVRNHVMHLKSFHFDMFKS